MKKSRIPLILSLFALCACQGNNISEDTKPSESLPTETAKPTETAAPNTYRPNVYEQLTYALEDLNNSMTLTGKLSYATSDGTTTSTSESEVTAEIDQDAYYYREADQITNETLVEENFFAGEDGFMYARTLDPLTNEVVETKSSNKYDIAMESPLPELEVKCLDAVREKPNWFIIKSKYHSLASRIVYFLTGYQTTGLPSYKPNGNSYSGAYDYTPTVSEFALHYNGDEIDQFRFIVELEISEDDGTYIYEGMQFELDISELGMTTPRSIEPLEHTAGHDKLTSALAPYRYDNEALNNYTMHVDLSYDSKLLTGHSYDYLIDFKKQIIYNTYEFTGILKPETEGGEYTEYKYNFAYQFENGRIYIYRYLADDTHAFVKKDEFSKYWGFTSSQADIGTSFLDAAPKIGSLAVECFKDNGDNTFTPYKIYQTLALLSMNTFEEYVNEPTSGDYSVVLKDDGTLDCFKNSISGNFVLDGSTNTIAATETFTITIKDYNTTTVPSFCVPHE